MKRILVITTVLLLSINSFSQGIEFFHGTFNEALTKAKSEDKMLFVDFYTVWCGPCKMMTRDIFPQKEVGEYFNKKFIALKIDAEKGEGVELAKKYEVTGYPTMIFFNNDGSEKTRMSGATNSIPAFIDFAKKATGDSKGFEELFEAYENGSRDLDLVREILVSGPLYISKLEREEQIEWFKRFKEILQWYFVAKRPSEMVNEKDFQVIKMYLDGPNNGNPYVEHIYTNYEEWKKVVSVADLSRFMQRTNNQSIGHAVRAANPVFRVYVEDIKARLAQVYQDDPEADGEYTYYSQKYICEGSYQLYANKDIDAFLAWMDKWKIIQEKYDKVSTHTYGGYCIYLINSFAENIEVKHAKRVLKILNEGLELFNDDFTLWDYYGDFNAIANKPKEALKAYNKVIELSKGTKYESFWGKKAMSKIEKLEVN